MPDQLFLIAEPPAAYDAEREQRRATYRERLRAALQDPAFRASEGFPIADDDAILALSDPPYYTACPNPFLSEILAEWQMANSESGADELSASHPKSYYREPFAADVSEGKNDPIYNAHSYHTKVPHKAIMRYILHYTEPGDVVLDGFCGTGMTGVAAQLCGDREVVQSLGYFVDDAGNIFDAPPAPKAEIENPKSRLGARRAILVDLSPAATFIAYNYNTPVDAAAFEREARRILKEVEAECGWMYETQHAPGVKGKINYTVWSDVFVCGECGGEIVFWEAAVDQERGAVRKEFPCPHCNALQSKRALDRAWETVFDTALKQPVRRTKQVPVLLNYSVGKKRYEKTPDAEDLALIQRIEEREIPYWFPIDLMMFKGKEWGDMWRPYHGETKRPIDFFTKRNLFVLSTIYQKIEDSVFSLKLLQVIMDILKLVSKMRMPGAGQPPQNMYMPSLFVESNVIATYSRKCISFQKIANLWRPCEKKVLISTQSSTALRQLSDDAVDYIFVDPPFGGNIMYSELSFFFEAWLRVFTYNRQEAIVSDSQRKELPDYLDLLVGCFSEFYRVLKPGHWITVEFHNSQNAVWNAIQEAILRAGFVVADVRTLDKQQGTFKQQTTTGAVKQDLIISAYKPNDNLEARFRRVAGTGQGIWDFVDYHLGRLPLPVLVGNRLEGVAERQNYLLFDRMVAFHVQRGYPVPLDAAEFYAGLAERYSIRDKMYFLPQQATEYDRRFLQAQEVGQLPLIVTDRSSARQWVRLRLEEGPRTEGELQPLFMREAQRAWGKNEEPVELRDLLHEDFVQDAEGRWVPPDPNQEQHLAQLRERRLQRVFEGYLKEKGRLRVFRKEALLAGFRYAWREQRYADILAVAARLPARVLQEDAQLLMYADNARIKAEG
ncbi:MAG: DNA methylase [Anaerolineae bacterium]|nr:DNA methylase [Anaerolineae bacterium]